MSTTQATCITGERATAIAADCQICRMRAATHVLRLINEGWILRPCSNGYTLTPPCVQGGQS